MARAKSAPRKLSCEQLESRVLLAQTRLESDIILDFLWPAGGNNGLTYERHSEYHDVAFDPVASIDINQDVERSDLEGGTLDAEKFDEADGGAPVFAAHDGIAIVHALGDAEEDRGYGYSVEIVAYDYQGADPQNPAANRLYSTFYGHLHETFVVNGDRVRLGQVIGRIGGSGQGVLDQYLPHIHFEFQNSERDAVSVNSPLQVPGHQDTTGPVRFYKGMLQAAASHQLSASTVLYGTDRQDVATRSSVTVAAARPNERLPVDMKGFDWDESVSIRITDATGSVAYPYRDVHGSIQPTVTTAIENDEDITELSEDGSGSPDLMPLFESPGLYYLQALEHNRDVGWGTATDREGVLHGNDVPPGETRTVPFATWNQRVGWAQLDWASETEPEQEQEQEKYPRGSDADAINLAVIVSPFAPPSGIGEVTRTDRSNGVTWRLLQDGTLVITGTDAADSIEISFAEAEEIWLFTINESQHPIPNGQLTSVFVDAGEGDDQISLQSLPATIGASVFGRGGDDTIHGGAAADILAGGPGADRIVGGPGDDWIFGNEGDDWLVGHTQGDKASSAVDHVFGEGGVDQLTVDFNDDSAGETAVGWQHPENRFDVTNDGHVVPLDALALINEINSPEYCHPNGRLPNQRPLDAFYYDSNGDGFCTPVGDVLPIVNFLNGTSATAEGEPTTNMDDFTRFALNEPLWVPLPACPAVRGAPAARTRMSCQHPAESSFVSVPSSNSWRLSRNLRIDADAFATNVRLVSTRKGILFELWKDPERARLCVGDSFVPF